MSKVLAAEPGSQIAKQNRIAKSGSKTPRVDFETRTKAMISCVLPVHCIGSLMAGFCVTARNWCVQVEMNRSGNVIRVAKNKAGLAVQGRTSKISHDKIDGG